MHKTPNAVLRWKQKSEKLKFKPNSQVCDDNARVFNELYSFQTDSVSIIKEGLQDESSSGCDADAVLGS